MIVSQGFERLSVEEHTPGYAGANGPDLSEWQPAESSGHLDVGANGEEDLVVLAAVESLLEAGAGKARRGYHDRAYLGGFAQAGEVDR